MHCYISLCLIEPLLMRWCSGSLVLFFCLEWGRGNKLCIRGHASKNKPDRLPLHIHVSRSRFIASWHNVRTINVSYVARLSHYRDSLTCCSFKYKMYTAPANKTFWVCGCPLWRVGGVCSQSPALIKLEGVGAPRSRRDPCPPWHKERRREARDLSVSARFLRKKKKNSCWRKLDLNCLCFSRSSWHSVSAQSSVLSPAHPSCHCEKTPYVMMSAVITGNGGDALWQWEEAEPRRIIGRDRSSGGVTSLTCCVLQAEISVQAAVCWSFTWVKVLIQQCKNSPI